MPRTLSDAKHVKSVDVKNGEQVNMKREELKKLLGESATDEVIDQIMSMNGKDIESHKGQVTDLTKQIETVNTQLGDANKQIESFKSMKPEELQAAADEWKTKFEEAQKTASEQLAQVKFDHALESALTGAKAKNVKAVQALLQRDALKLNDDGSILGLNEQLEKIKTDADYLFESDKPAPRVVAGGNSKSVIGDPVVMAARKAAGLPLEAKE